MLAVGRPSRSREASHNRPAPPERRVNWPVAYLDRAPPSEGGGSRFDPGRADMVHFAEPQRPRVVLTIMGHVDPLPIVVCAAGTTPPTMPPPDPNAKHIATKATLTIDGAEYDVTDVVLSKGAP
jgi:hypothetical protein